MRRHGSDYLSAVASAIAVASMVLVCVVSVRESGVLGAPVARTYSQASFAPMRVITPGRMGAPREFRPSMKVHGNREINDVRTRLATPADESVDMPVYNQIAQVVNDEELMVPEEDLMSLYQVCFLHVPTP